MAELTDEERSARIAWIAQATYEQLLHQWRFAAAADPYFIDKTVFDCHQARMVELRRADPGEHVRASKAMGWEAT